MSDLTLEEIENIKNGLIEKRVGYAGKSQQWMHGNGLASKEVCRASMPSPSNSFLIADVMKKIIGPKPTEQAE
jgi:hypothetical protein